MHHFQLKIHNEFSDSFIESPEFDSVKSPSGPNTIFYSLSSPHTTRNGHTKKTYSPRCPRQEGNEQEGNEKSKLSNPFFVDVPEKTYCILRAGFLKAFPQ
jgi:hypothetical protein